MYRTEQQQYIPQNAPTYPRTYHQGMQGYPQQFAVLHARPSYPHQIVA